jgi:uncharacterized repeat protein (TIGR03803 family)
MMKYLASLTFALAAMPAQAQFTEVVLHNFDAGAPAGGSPVSPLTRDSAGNLYGTASEGGALGYGAIYKIDAKGIETVLYSFTNGADGAYPFGGVIFDSAGNLYGTTNSGALQTCPGSSNQDGCGVVFELGFHRQPHRAPHVHRRR